MSQMKNLAHVVALAENTKNDLKAPLSKKYFELQNRALFEGMIRTYEPFEDDGSPSSKVPPEGKQVQNNVRFMMKELRGIETKLLDTMLWRDRGNQTAIADLVMPDGTVLGKALPSSYLLYLRQRLFDIRTVIDNIPVHNPEVTWEWDPNRNVYKSEEPIIRIRTEKKQKPIVLYNATEKHPAQTQLITEDTGVGRWVEVRFSACEQPAIKAAMQQTINDLITATENAISDANRGVNVDIMETVGDKIFDKLFAPMTAFYDAKK